jgi:hypothetical protein
MNMLEMIKDFYEAASFLKMDGYDDAVIGFDEDTTKLIYSESKCIEILIERDKMDREGAIEYFRYNSIGANNGNVIICSDYL